MTSPTLQERLATVERDMHEVKAVLQRVDETQQPWWERLAGTFKDDPMFDEVVEAGHAYRRSLAPHARR
ncbi:MAG: hypothetical protein HY709_09905 [Candidatus Latescibacteria bacterium]|nr:hypothetical protein [Candidatus Latescibacterota bacterium]